MRGNQGGGPRAYLPGAVCPLGDLQGELGGGGRDTLAKDLDTLREHNMLLRERGMEIWDEMALTDGKLGKVREELA